MKTKRFVSLITVIAMCISVFANIPVTAEDYEPVSEDDIIYELMADGDTYTADFKQLIGKDLSQDIQLDDYTVAHLTYAGTTVDASGVIHLTGSGTNNKYSAAVSGGSYIQFTAPSDGDVTFTINYANYFVDTTYVGYGSTTVALTEGQKLTIGSRASDRSTVTSITFKEKEVIDLPVASEYVSPSTTWDFDSSIPAGEGKNVPVISGSAVYDSSAKGIKFPYASTAAGALKVELENPIKSSGKDKNVKISFDTANMIKTFGSEFNTYKVLNSEGSEIVKIHMHPYGGTGYTAEGLVIGGETIADNDALLKGQSADGRTTEFVITIDYYAMKATVQVGGATFTGDIPGGTIKDFQTFELTCTRSKTEGSRYFLFDNLKIEEFTSAAEPAAESEITNGYEAKTLAGMVSRVNAPSGEGLPLVVYLHSASRNGSDNESQLYQAKSLFDILKDSAVLAAPQTQDNWDASALKAYIDAAKEEYKTGKTVVIGYDEGASAAYALASNGAADKIVPIAGTADVSAKVNAKVWAFGGFLDDKVKIADIRKPVNALQTAGSDVRYTEYPTDGHNIPDTAAVESGLTDWILNDIEDKKEVDLVLFAGQSNMAGRGNADEAIKAAPGEGYEFHSVTNPNLADGQVPYVLSIASEPFGKNDNNSKIHDNGSDGVDRRAGDMVGALMKAYYAKTGVPIVGVQASRGGQSTSYFLGNDYKTDCEARYKAAADYLEKAGYTVRRKFIVWCQGENDAEGTLNSNYKTNTLSIFSNMKALGMTDMFMVKIGHRNGDSAKDAQYKQINEWQQELADENDNIYAVADLYTDEYFAQMRDQYHYYQPVYNNIGDTAGTAIAAIYAGEAIPTPKPMATATPKPTMEPAEAEFEITSNNASIDVSNMKSYGADTFRVYKADGSYEDVKAVSGKVANTTGGEVTVVPVYRFNYSKTAKEGYTTATASYSASAGYGVESGVTTDANGALPSKGSLRVDLPNGRYDITVIRQGSTRFNVYNDGYKIMSNDGINNGSQNRPNGSGIMYAPQVLNDDKSINITVDGVSGSPRVATMEIVRVPEKYKKSVVWIAGDSESAVYYPQNANGDDLDSGTIMMTGFGMMLPKLLSDDYKVCDLGQPSGTVKMWSDGNLTSVLHNMDEGDIIIVDFGINEVVSSSNKISLNEMKQYMQEIFTESKKLGAKPILVSPVSCGKYQDRAYFRYVNNTNDMYAFAKECGVDCIDLNKWLQLYIAKASQDTGVSEADWKRLNYHVGDNLHMTQHGALLAASFIAAGMSDLGCGTTDFAYLYKDISEIGDGNIRGSKNGNIRVYSVAAAKQFMKDGTVVTEAPLPKPTEVPKATDAPKATDEPAVTAAPITADAITISGNDVTVTLDGVSSAVLIKASHNTDGRLINVETYDLTFTNGKAEQKNLSLRNGDELYVWDSLSGMKPLAGKKTVTALPQTEATPTPTSAVIPTPKAADGPVTRPTARPIPDAADSPTTLIHEQDFENATVGSTASGKNNYVEGWFSTAGTVTVKTDSTSGINKYMAVTGGNAARSGYYNLSSAVSQNFVFEADLKTVYNASRVSELQLVEQQSSVYENHGVYSNQKYVFTMDRPAKERFYVINNGVSDSGLTLDGYNQPPVITDTIANDAWVHVKVVGNFDTGKVVSYITSLDGKTEYYHGMADMSEGIKSFKCIHVLGPTAGVDTNIDNIKIRTAAPADLAPVYHKVKITSGNESFEQYVLDGEGVVNIPDTSSFGDSFEGWIIGNNPEVLSTSQLASTSITEDCEINIKINDNYIEPMASVDFGVFPAANELVMGADENTYGDNTISLSIIGEQGTSLAVNPDSRVQDYKIEWTIDGFKTLDGKPTGETGSAYCDSYGLVEITETAQSTVNFKLKKTAANYYGRVKVRVTYNGKTLEAEKPLVLLGDKSGTTILPRSGYTADFNKYESTMMNYRVSNGNTAVDGWESSGSDSTYMDLKSDATGQYLSISRAASGNSSYVSNTIGDITGQTVFKQDVRFGMNGSIEYGVGDKSSNTDISASRAFQLSFDGSKLSLNGTKICDAGANTWYHTEVTADPTTKKCYAKVYDMDGKLLGESAIMAFQTYTSGMFYHIVLGTRTANKSIDINNVTVYEAETDADTIEITAPETAQIPDNSSETVKLSATAKTTDGADAIGAVTWTIDDELAEGVSIAADGTLTITPEASSGNLPIRATIGGKSAVKTIKLTGTKNNVAFTEAPLGIQIGSAGDYQYTAELRNGQAEKIDGTITYSLADSTGAAKAYSGVEINGTTGVLTVAANTQPQTIYIKAASGEYTRLAKTVVYSLKFSFGLAAQSGYTQVTSATSYSDSKGFGIVGLATDEASDITGSGVTFKVKLEKGKVYSVKAKYEGTIRLERVNSDFTGFDRTKASLAEDSYNVAIFDDDVMDITLPSGGKIATVEITPVTKSKAQKPDWWTIGDSTIQQNGSWGYTIASSSTTNLSKYPELSAVVNGFHNSGQAGRQHKNYYTEGLLNNVLTGINPGDVVSISGMGTNDSSSSKEQFKAYDEMYLNAILDMGAYVILGSYTPTGNYGETQGKVYDADTMTFKGMRTKAYDLAIRELYEEYKDNDHVLGFIDIGKMADDKMTADVKAAYDAALGDEAAKRAAANARAEEMMAWWKDYNHYYTDFSNYILPDITKAVAELVNNR